MRENINDLFIYKKKRAHRYEIVFALGTTIYLMFATMHNTKESLEHFLLQDHHGVEVHDNEE